MNEEKLSVCSTPDYWIIDEAADDPWIVETISLLVNDESIDQISVSFLQSKLNLDSGRAECAIAYLQERGILEKPETIWKIKRDVLNEQYPF